MVQIFKKLVKLDAYKYAYIFVIVILFASYFSDAKGTVVWSTSDASIGTTNQNGILTISKNGCVYVIGETNGMKFSKLVYIGVPTYLLSSKHKPDGFEIEAKCIDETYKANIDNINSSLIFRWGVKFPNKDIRWIDTNSPSVFIPIEDKDAVVFLKIIDSNGKESPLLSVKCTATDIFYAANNRLLLDAAKKYTKKMGLRIHTNTARYTLLKIFLCLKNMKVTSGLLRKLKYIARLIVPT